ncbi:acyl-CoA carboxylase subunit epsilon [Streptomyces bicolor]|uniref:acyl-CoA carboxylase subunit epsilon n=1 Tax=Streptomyces bicolor TaxID=66874 RepID=UPI0004E1EA22|nr:acyl-CoA carboxylase subunit epsilon [Streptomyces bicolor]
MIQANHTNPAQLLRIEKGSPDPEELAALTAVLLSRTAAVGAEPDDLSRRHRAVARWRRLERAQGFDGPRSWRGVTR